MWNVLVFNYYDSKGIAVPAEYEFYAQWANLSFYNAPINLNLFSDIINQSITGLEAGYPSPTNISSSTAIDLWDPANTSSFVNDAGFLKWNSTRIEPVNGSTRLELNSTFYISQPQISQIITWLFTPVKQNLVPNLMKYPEPYGFGMNTTEYSEILLYEQWANGTYVPLGLELEQGYKGIEAGIPIKTNISLETTLALFDETNTSSFVNRHGILKWIEAAEGDVIVQNELISTFNLNIDQLNLTNDWLLSTLRYYLIPNLVSRYPISSCKEYRNSLNELIFKCYEY